MKTKPARGLTRSSQAGFSMVELLMAAFVMAIGILGITMLQVMSMRASTGSRALNSAVMLGEGVLESIQSEGRQRMLFYKYSGVAPATTYFGGAPMTQYYSFDGTILPDATNAYYTVAIVSNDVVALSAAGGTRNFVLTVSFLDTPNPSNPSLSVYRTVTLTRQIAYA